MLSVSYLSPPNKKSRQFQKNYLDKFIVEFRFPVLLEKFHEVHFSFFWWSFGEKAREGLIDA